MLIFHLHLLLVVDSQTMHVELEQWLVVVDLTEYAVTLQQLVVASLTQQVGMHQLFLVGMQIQQADILLQHQADMVIRPLGATLYQLVVIDHVLHVIILLLVVIKVLQVDIVLLHLVKIAVQLKHIVLQLGIVILLLVYNLLLSVLGILQRVHTPQLLVDAATMLSMKEQVLVVEHATNHMGHTIISAMVDTITLTVIATSLEVDTAML